jgi:O-antigen ligase
MNKLKKITEYWDNVYFIPIILSLLTVNFIPLYIILILLSLITITYGEKYLISYTILTFLLFTSSVDSSLRLIVQITNLLLLVYLFVKNFGFDFKEYEKVPYYVSTLIFSFFAIMIISITFSKYQAIGFEQLVRSIQFFVFIYLFYASISYYKYINQIIITFYIICVFFSILLTYQFLFTDISQLLLNRDYMLKLKEIYIHKNTISLFLTNTILISFALIYFEGLKKYNIFFKVLIFIFFLSLIITNSRSSLITTIIGILFLSYYLNKKIILYTIVSLIFLVAISFLPQINQIIMVYLRIEQISSGRDVIYPAVINAIPHIWLTGAGPAASQYYMFEYFPFQIGSPEQSYWNYYVKHTEIGHAHNFYLFYFADLGILGFLFTLFLPTIFITLGYKSFKFYKNNNDNYNYLLSLAITAIGICYFIRGLFEWGAILSYGFMSIDLPFWIFFIILIYLYKGTKTTKNY